MKADWRAQSARPREMSLANLLREAKGGACPECHKVNTTTALALPEPLVKPLFAESRKTQETTMQSRSTKKSAVVVLSWIATNNVR